MATKKQITEEITEAITEEIIEEVSEPSDEQSAEPSISAKDYYNELVTVKLFKDSNRYKDDVFVAVNGVGMIVPRGVEVRIPRKYAEALANSEQQNSFSVQYQSRLQSEAVISESAI